MFYPEIQKKALVEIRNFVFKGTILSDDDILCKKIKELDLDVNSLAPGISPYQALASKLKSCCSEKIAGFDGDFIIARKEKTVEDIIDYLDSAQHAIIVGREQGGNL